MARDSATLTVYWMVLRTEKRWDSGSEVGSDRTMVLLLVPSSVQQSIYLLTHAMERDSVALMVRTEKLWDPCSFLLTELKSDPYMAND